MASEQASEAPSHPAADHIAAMVKPSNRRAVFPALVAAVASGALFYFGTGLHPVWWLTWLAPFPVLLVAPHAKSWPAFVMAGSAWLIGSLNMWQQARALQVPIGIVLAMLIVPAFLFSLVVLLFRAWVRRGGLWQASLSYPAAWVAIEFLNAIASPHGTFPNLGYTQLDCLPVLQVVSLVGIWGISFCLLLVPAVAAALLSQQRSPAQKIKLAAIACAILIAVFSYGF